MGASQEHDAAELTPPTDLNELHARIWAQTVSRGEGGALEVGGVDVHQLAREFGTPLFVVDEADFLARAQRWKDAFADVPGAKVYYAGKAFLCVAVARWLDQVGLGLDVCSGGELAVALRAGFPTERITMHGNNKSVAELERAVASGVGRIVVDSFEEIERLAAVATVAGVRQRVLVRVTVGVSAHTHDFTATAHEDQKFGLSVASGAAAEAVRRVLAQPSLELLGLHSHIGSQVVDTAGFEVAAGRIVELTARIRQDHGVDLPELDLGGGLAIAYTPEESAADPFAIAERLRKVVEHECGIHGLPVPALTVEPGRSIAGPTAFTLYEVGTVKPVETEAGSRTYVSVDGGFVDNLRTALYGARYSCVLAGRTSQAGPMLARVVGKHCENGDVLVRDVYLPADVAPGDLLAVPATGAYGRSMANNYNHLARPAVVAVADGQCRVVVRRETEEDLLRLDVG